MAFVLSRYYLSFSAGADLGGFVGFERTPLFADSFDLLILCYSASSVRHSVLACQSSLATV